MIQEKLGFGDSLGMKCGKGFDDHPLFKGKLNIRLFDSGGNIKEEREINNTVTTTGKNSIIDQLLASPALTKPTHMEVGIGTPAADALGSAVAASRTALSAKTRTNAVLTMVCTFAAGTGTGALTEAGIFNSASGAGMYCSAAFNVINKAAGDSLEITWTLTAS